jgi:hypothetical protein
MIVLLGAVLAMGGIAAGGVALWANQEAQPQDDPAQTTAPAAVEAEKTTAAKPVAEDDITDAANAEDVAKDVGEPAPKQKPVAPAATPTPPAKLTVVVFPWGDVWINGKPVVLHL